MNVAHPSRGLSGDKGPLARDSVNQGIDQWRPRDILAAVLLFLATAGFVLWQNSRVAVLWDLGYLLDTSWRIALGQMPYRDFPLAHAPVTFVLQAALMRLAGRHYLLPIAYAAMVGGLGTVLTWRILLRVLPAAGVFNRFRWATALMLAAPLAVVGVYSIYPHPIYDCDCSLSTLFAIWLLARLSSQPGLPSRPALSLCAGAAAVLPLLVKQNMGLPFLAAVAAGMFVLLALDGRKTRSLSAVLRSQPA